MHTREQQARFLARAWLEQLAGGAEKMFWYVSRDYSAFKTMGVFGDIARINRGRTELVGEFGDTVANAIVLVGEGQRCAFPVAGLGNAVSD